MPKRSLDSSAFRFEIGERLRDALQWLRAPWAGALLAVLAIAVLARLWDLGRGLPHVYEEATPLKRAWEMWGWGPAGSVDLNPHFFNYPSLTFYLHFLSQVILYAAMKVSGKIEGPADFQLAYLTDPTPFHLLGRSISVAFGVATVAVVFFLGRRAGGTLGGTWTAGIAAALLASSSLHVAESRSIAVDAPLTFFTTLTASV